MRGAWQCDRENPPSRRRLAPQTTRLLVLGLLRPWHSAQVRDVAINGVFAACHDPDALGCQLRGDRLFRKSLAPPLQISETVENTTEVY